MNTMSSVDSSLTLREKIMVKVVVDAFYGLLLLPFVLFMG
jgi:hypothetical protein